MRSHLSGFHKDRKKARESVARRILATPHQSLTLFGAFQHPTGIPIPSWSAHQATRHVEVPAREWLRG
jgi:hypothetical protein